MPHIGAEIPLKTSSGEPHIMCLKLIYTFYPHPPFGLQKVLYTPLNVSVLPFESSALVSLLLRITTGQTSQIAAMRPFVHRRLARNMHVSCSHCCIKRTCVIKSLLQAIESSPVIFLDMFKTFPWGATPRAP